MSKRDLANELLKSFRTKSIKRREKTAPIQKVHTARSSEPELISGVLNNLINERGWESGIAEGTLFVSWVRIIGVEIARHTTPLSISDGVLTVRASSTAWATQLSLMSGQLLEIIQRDTAGVLVETIVFIGPQKPSWKRGIRTIRGARGPRDTYG